MNATMIKGERSKLLAVALLAMFMVVAGSVVALGDNVDATGDATAENAVASIGDQYYSTLDLAVQDATKGTPEDPVEITLLKDATLGKFLENIVISAAEKHTITLTSAIQIDGTVGLENVEVATDDNYNMAFYTGNYSADSPITFSMDRVSFDESVNCEGDPMTVYLDKVSTITITGCDFTNSKVVYAGAEGANPDVTISNTTNVDMNVTSAGTVTVGTDLKIEGTSTIGDVLLAGGVQLTVPEEETFTAASIGIYVSSSGDVSSGYIVTETDNVTVTEETIDAPIVNPASDSITVSTEQMLKDAIDGTYETIIIDGEIKVTSVIKVDRAVTIKGINDATLLATPADEGEQWYVGEWVSGAYDNQYVISIVGTSVEGTISISDITVDSDTAALGFNVWGGNVEITNVASVDSAGAGFVIGRNATVDVDNISASSSVEDYWGGMNIDKGAKVTFTDAESFRNIGSVYSENYDNSVSFPEGYVPAVEMAGTWSDGNTTYHGFYSDIDNLIGNYSDSRFAKENSTITVNDDVKLDTDFTVEDGTTLTVSENAVLTVPEDVDLVIEGTIVEEGTVAGAPEYNGIRYDPDTNTAYVNTYEDLNQVVRNEKNITTVYLMSSVAAPGPQGITRPDVTSADEAVTIYLGDGTEPVTLDMAGAILNLQNVTVDVPAGSQLIVSNAIKYVGLDHIVTHAGSMIDVTGATLYVANEPTGSEDPVTVDYLTMSEGTLFRYSNAWFTIYHGETTSDMDVQYGFALNITYNGISHAGNINGFHAVPFDNYFSTGNETSGQILEYDQLTEQERLDLGDVSGITFNNSEKNDCIDAGYYVVRTTLSITAPGGDVVPFSDVSVFRIAPADSQAVFDGVGTGEDKTPTVVTDKDDPTKITVSGEVQFDGNEYYVIVSFQGKEFQNGILVDVNDYTGRLVTVDGQPVEVTNGTIRLPIDMLTGTSPVDVVYDADGEEGTNYNPTTYTISFSGLTATAGVDIRPMTDQEYTDLGYAAEDSVGVPLDAMISGDFVVEETAVGDDTNVAFTDGILNYMTEFPWYVGGSDVDSYGWYIPIAIQLNGLTWADVISLDIDNGYFTGSSDDPVDLSKWTDSETTYYVIIKVIDPSKTGITVEIDYVDDAFGTDTFYVDLSGLTFGINTGYVPTVPTYTPGVEGSTIDLGGITATDVTPETMYFIHSTIVDLPEGVTTDDLKHGLFYGGHYTAEQLEAGDIEMIYTEDNGSSMLWYFSFADYEGIYNYLNGLTEAERPDYTLGALGAYTMALYYETETGIEVLKVGYEDLAGTIDAGYDQNAETVFNDMAEAGIVWEDEPGWEPTDDYTNWVAPSTMWIVWYNAQAYTGDVTASVYYNGSDTPLYYETSDLWNSIGLKKWYFSDDSQWGDVQDRFQPGEYVIKITAENVEEPVATATVYIPGTIEGNYGFSDTVQGAFDGITDAGGKINNVTPEDPDGDLTTNVGWLVWYGEAYESVTATLKWNGTTIFVETDDAIPTWLDAGVHTWYFTLNGGGQVMTWVSGKDTGYTACAPGTYEMTITVNGSDDPIATGEFTIREEGTFHVNYVDEDWGTDGYNEEVIVDDKYVVLPALPDASKVAYGWYVEGSEAVVYPAGALVDVSKYTDVLGNVTFIATYVTDVRDDYTMTVENNEGILSISVNSTQVNDVVNGIVYQNLTANHYYTIRVAYANGTSASYVIASDKILNGGYGYQESFDFTVPNYGPGCTVVVEFAADYSTGFVAFDDYEYYNTPVSISGGSGATAADVATGIDAAFDALGSDRNASEITDISPETAFAVFNTTEELNGVTLTANVIDSEGQIVYSENMVFDEAGAHVFYFTMAEGYENANKDYGTNGDISSAFAEGGTFYIYIMNGQTPIFDPVTITVAA